jgi:hypothetical protein
MVPTLSRFSMLFLSRLRLLTVPLLISDPPGFSDHFHNEFGAASDTNLGAEYRTCADPAPPEVDSDRIDRIVTWISKENK